MLEKNNKTRWNYRAGKTVCANLLAMTFRNNKLPFLCAAKLLFNLDPFALKRDYITSHKPSVQHLSVNGLHLTSKVAHCCGEDGNEVGVHD